MLLQLIFLSSFSATATCSDACPEGSGCFGPDDPLYCGQCYTADNINSCNAIERPGDSGSSCPGWWPPTEDPFTTLFALVVAFGIVVIVLLGVLLCLLGCKIRKCMTDDEKGSYSISNKVYSSRYTHISLIYRLIHRPIYTVSCKFTASQGSLKIHLEQTFSIYTAVLSYQQ